MSLVSLVSFLFSFFYFYFCKAVLTTGVFGASSTYRLHTNIESSLKAASLANEGTQDDGTEVKVELSRAESYFFTFLPSFPTPSVSCTF